MNAVFKETNASIIKNALYKKQKIEMLFAKSKNYSPATNISIETGSESV
jgi:hypothetical protein